MNGCSVFDYTNECSFTTSPGIEYYVLCHVVLNTMCYPWAGSVVVLRTMSASGGGLHPWRVVCRPWVWYPLPPWVGGWAEVGSWFPLLRHVVFNTTSPGNQYPVGEYSILLAAGEPPQIPEK